MTKQIKDLNKLENILDIFQGIRDQEVERRRTIDERTAMSSVIQNHKQL